MDYSNLLYEHVNFRSVKNNEYLSYNKKPFVISLNEIQTITELQEEGKNKYTIVIRINEQQKEFFLGLQKHIMETLKINSNEFIPIVKKDFIKLKLEYRGKFQVTIKQDGELFTPYELEKGLTAKCNIHLKNIWKFNGKCGLIMVLKNLTVI